MSAAQRPEQEEPILRYPDVREEHLPAWARGVLRRLREEIGHLEPAQRPDPAGDLDVDRVRSLPHPLERAREAGELITRLAAVTGDLGATRREALEELIASGASQAQLAADLGLTRARIWQIMQAAPAPELDDTAARPAAAGVTPSPIRRPDPTVPDRTREGNLPIWARSLISDLRNRVAYAERQEAEAVAVAELARGTTSPDTALVAVEGDGDGQVGIPGTKPLVTFRDPRDPTDLAREIEVSRDRQGRLLVEAATGHILIHPRDRSSFLVTLEATP
jgi:hypothetical protein